MKLSFLKPYSFAAVLSANLCLRVLAQTGDAPTVIQAALFAKIFAYEQVLASKKNFAVCIPFASLSDTVETDIAKQFRTIGVAVEFINESQLNLDTFKRFDAVYMFSNINAREIHALLTKNGVLSITGAVPLVKEGLASVCVSLENSKPRIMVSKPCVKNERRSFSADFWSMVKVFE